MFETEKYIMLKFVRFLEDLHESIISPIRFLLCAEINNRRIVQVRELQSHSSVVSEDYL